MKYSMLPLLLSWPLACRADATSDALVDAARSAVQARLGEYADVSLEVTGRPGDGLPSLGADTRLRISSVPGRFPRERFTVDVAILRGSKTLASGTVGFALHANTEAWVYGHDASRGGTPDVLGFRRAPVDVAHVRDVLADGPEALAGLRLKHAVREGDPVEIGDFEKIPDVDLRQAVRLRAAFGDIMVESAGMALRSGNRGDTVTVQVAGGTSPVKATVIDKGVAELVP